MNSRRTGSITVFMSLMLMVIASLLFTLLEGSRILMLGMTAIVNSQTVTESVFAEYHVPAYQNYHLLMMDSSYGTGQLLLSKVNQKMQELGQENLNPTIIGFGRYHNFLQMNVTDSNVVRYELATDQDAEPLMRQISQLMKKEIVVDLTEAAYEKITDIQESGKQGQIADKYLDGAFDTIEQAKEEAKKAEQQSARGQKILGEFYAQNMNSGKKEVSFLSKAGDISQIDTELGVRTAVSEQASVLEQDIENPMDHIKSAKDSPLLAQILTNSEGVSTKQISIEDSVEKRILNIGNYENTDSSGVVDKILMMQYLKKYTANYRNKISFPHALAYEQEYILFGKASDEDNLKKMASRLLLIREGINFAYLITDHAKCEEAFAVAASVSAVAGIPAAVKAIQMGILASWAYAESIAELRTLFSGGKIAAVKTAENWTIGLAEAASVPFRNEIKSKEVNHGLGYEDYLQAFLALESLKKIGIRFASLLEKNIRLYAGYEQVKLDCMITAMETSNVYEAEQVFLSFVTITRLSKKGYKYEKKYQFSYTDQKGSS